MPDEKLPETLDDTATPSESAPEGGVKAIGSTRVAPPSVLQRDSDRVSRPGFRNPPNAKSKAQKAGRKK